MLFWVVLGILIVILLVLLLKFVLKKTRVSDFFRIFILLVVSSLLIILPYLNNFELDKLDAIYSLIIGVGVNELLGIIYAMFINNYPNKQKELEQELLENKLLFNYIYISVLFSIFIAKTVVKDFLGEYTIFVIFVITTLITIILIMLKEHKIKVDCGLVLSFKYPRNINKAQKRYDKASSKFLEAEKELSREQKDLIKLIEKQQDDKFDELLNLSLIKSEASSK